MMKIKFLLTRRLTSMSGLGLFLLMSLPLGSTQADSGVRPAVVSLGHRDSGRSNRQSVVLKAAEVSYKDVIEKAEISWSELSCETAADPNKAKWHNYFNLPRKSKAAALTASIAGLDLTTAKAILDSDDGFLTRKPANWNMFKNEIQLIEQKIPAPGLYFEVVVRHGEENAKNLGYYYPPNDDNDDTKGGSFLVSKHGLLSIRKRQEEVTRLLEKRVTVEFQHPVLLTGETETVVLEWDGRSDSIMVDATMAANVYTVDQEDSTYILRSSGRSPVRPDVGDFRASSFKDGEILKLSIRDSRENEVVHNLQDKADLAINFVIVEVGKNGEADKVLSRRQVLTDKEIDINLSALVPRSLKPGSSYQVRELCFERLRTTYFGGVSESVNLPEIKF